MRENDFVDYDSSFQMDAAEVAHVQELVAALFGDPHPDVIFDGVFFHERRFPFTIYPDALNPKRIAVCLPQHQADNELARFFHLSHELVHCLNPNGPRTGQATVFEEGLAEHAKIYLVEQFFQSSYAGVDFRALTPGKYQMAFELVEHLVSDYGLQEMRQIVKTMRAETRRPFAEIRSKHLHHYFPKSDSEVLEKLGSRFHDN